MADVTPPPPRPWLPRRWVAGAVLAVAAIAGLLIARSADGSTGYVGGLFLFVAATLGVFALISTGYGPSPLLRVRWFPAHGTVRWAVGGVIGALAIAGLFHAASAQAGGFAYYDGLGIFLTATAYDFVLLKDWFDRRSPGPS